MTELVERVSAGLVGKAAPEAVLDRASREVRTALQQGEAVDILGLVRVRLTAKGLQGGEYGPAALSAEPMPGLLPEKTAPETADKSDIVVIIAADQRDMFNEVLAKRLTAPGRSAHVAEGITGVRDAVKEFGADVVIIDSDLEMAEEVRQWLKAAPERSLISLIAIYRQEDSPDKVNGFRVCENECLTEPYEMQALEDIITEEIRRIRMERKYFQHEVSFQFPTQAVYQQQAADFMEKLAAHSGLDEEGQTGLVVAFREAVDNAARHGNHSEKTALVTIAYVLDREKVTVTIEDEGPGFDTSRYIETRVSGDAVAVARQRHAEGRQGGLGIMLMLKSVDRIEYNQKGNVLKLTKLLKK
jgi:anti-sigma regulatory factor (Ser/Thr protein kinase)